MAATIAALPSTDVLLAWSSITGPEAKLASVTSWLGDGGAAEDGLLATGPPCGASGSGCSSCDASEVELVIAAESSSSASSSYAPPSCSLSGRSASETGLASLSSFCARDSHACTTADGWRLHIQHVYDPLAEAGCSGQRHHPVLLVPGLASSGEHTFDLLPEASLVATLVGRGYDVWVADLRGNGRSQKPSVLDSSTWWTVDDHFLQDVPAVLEYVLAATGASQLHWVGHSMGGMLAVGLLSQRRALGRRLRSVTLLASGCFGRGSWHSVLRPLINRITRWGFPAGLVCSAIGALAGSSTALWLLEALFYWPANVQLHAAKRLMAGCFEFIPTGVIQQFMGSLNSEDGLSARDNSFRYADPAALAQVDVPVLGLNGSWDLFCPAAGGRRTVSLFGSAAKRFIEVGPSAGTARRHYGHFDVLCGRDAATEVYPHITGWLDAHDAPLPQQQLQQEQR